MPETMLSSPINIFSVFTARIEVTTMCTIRTLMSSHIVRAAPGKTTSISIALSQACCSSFLALENFWQAYLSANYLDTHKFPVLITEDVFVVFFQTWLLAYEGGATW